MSELRLITEAVVLGPYNGKPMALPKLSDKIVSDQTTGKAKDKRNNKCKMIDIIMTRMC